MEAKVPQPEPRPRWLSRGGTSHRGPRALKPAGTLPDSADVEVQAPRPEPGPLPMGFRVGMRVRVTKDIVWEDTKEVVATRHTPADVVEYCDEERIWVRCDRARRNGGQIRSLVQVEARLLERHPLETRRLDPRTAPPVHRKESNLDADSDGMDDTSRRWRDWELPQKPKIRPKEIGTGARYEVLAERVILRAAPSLKAPKQGYRPRGTVVELFEWDEACQWRRQVCSKSWISSWMMLDHAEYGPLLRPVDIPFQFRPHQPLCMAAHENSIGDVCAFLEAGHDPNIQDEGGWTPLARAAAAGHCEAATVLVMAGADVGRSTIQLRDRGADTSLPSVMLLQVFADAADPHLPRQLSLEIDVLTLKDRRAFVQCLRSHPSVQSRWLGWLLGHSDDEQDLTGLSKQDRNASIVGVWRSAWAKRSPPESAQQKSPMKCRVVSDSCVVRSRPNPYARKVDARPRGDAVELHRYDVSGHWGQIPPRGWIFLEDVEIESRETDTELSQGININSLD